MRGSNVDAGTVLLTDTDTGQLKAFDAAGVQGCSGSPTRTCQPLWTATINSMAVPSIAGGKVYVPDLAQVGGQVDVFDEAGSTNCSGTPKVCQPLFRVALPSGTAGSVDVAGGVGYVTASATPGTSNDLVAFDATGATGCSGVPIWCQPLWSAVLSGEPGVTAPAVSGGRVYVASQTSSGGVVDQFDASGVDGCSGSPVVCTRLVTTSPGASYLFGSPVVSNGLVIMKNAMYPADTSHCSAGAPIVCASLWTAPEVGYSSGSIISNGTAFLPSDDGGFIRAYRIPGT